MSESSTPSASKQVPRLRGNTQITTITSAYALGYIKKIIILYGTYGGSIDSKLKGIGKCVGVTRKVNGR